MTDEQDHVIKTKVLSIIRKNSKASGSVAEQEKATRPERSGVAVAASAENVEEGLYVEW